MLKKKILVFIDHDVMLRHFIANGTFRELESNNNVLYVFNEDKSRFDFKNNEIIKENIKKDQLRFTRIPRKRIGKWFLLYIINVFRQQRMALKNKGSKKHYQAILEHETRQIGKRNVFLAKIAGFPLIFQFITFLFKNKLGIHRDVVEIFDKEKPDIVIHPSFLNGYFINELFGITKKNNVPFIILVNSWDNCCSKAFCTGSPDKLIVWGEQARRHARQYLGTSDQKIESFGAAQFEVYKKAPQENRYELSKLFQVDSNKKIILYAGVGASENETKYLSILDKAISNSFLPNCHILYRPHPWRGKLVNQEKDFFSINWKNITMDPTMVDYYRSVIRNSDGKMFLADYSISNKLLTLVDAVISPLSTMLIEALIKGKPALAFFPETGQNEVLRLDHIHFSEFIEIKEANSCFTENEFLPKCKVLVNQIGDIEISNKLIKKSEFFSSNRKKSYGLQLADLVKSIKKK